MKKAYRNLNIAELLSRRLPFSVAAHLATHKNVGIFVLALSVIVHNCYFPGASFPKYCPENDEGNNMKRQIDDNLEQIFGEKTVYQHTVTTCCLKEKDSIKIIQPEIISPLSDHFNELRDNDDSAEVPMRTYAESEQCRLFHEKVLRGLGFSFEGHLFAFANALRISGLLKQFIEHITQLNPPVASLPYGPHLFWQGQRTMVPLQNQATKSDKAQLVSPKL